MNVWCEATINTCKDVWEAEVGTTLQCQRETGNSHDIYAVAVLKSGVIVGHVPKKYSPLAHCFSDMEEQFTVQLLVENATLLI